MRASFITHQFMWCSTMIQRLYYSVLPLASSGWLSLVCLHWSTCACKSYMRTSATTRPPAHHENCAAFTQHCLYKMVILAVSPISWLWERVVLILFSHSAFQYPERKPKTHLSISPFPATSRPASRTILHLTSFTLIILFYTLPQLHLGQNGLSWLYRDSSGETLQGIEHRLWC